MRAAMMWAEAFGTLRALVHGAQDEQGWLELCTRLEAAWRADAARVEEQWLPYLEGELGRWPDTLRVCPPPWRDVLVRGRAFPPLAIVRAVDWRGGLSDDVRRLAASRHAAQLTALTLRYVPLTTEALDALSTSALCDGMHTLSISHAELSSSGVLRLASARGMRAMRKLTLADVELGPAALEMLCGAMWIGRLTWLELSNNPFGVTGLKALLAAQAPLEVLHIASCGLGPEACAALVSSPASSALRELDMGHNALGDPGAAALAYGAFTSELSALTLPRCDIGDPGARALAASPQLRALRYLNLDDNPITRTGRQALLASPHLDAEVAARAAQLAR
jgi:hypothetical protein